MFEFFAHGFKDPDMALALGRMGTGLFFAISGGNKLFHECRHASLRKNLQRNGIPFLKFNEWFVPGVEFVAGITLALGLFTLSSAGLLFCICAVACWCEAHDKVMKYQPINRPDVVADYLYLPEVLYLLLLSVNILAGAGAYSLDSYLFPHRS